MFVSFKFARPKRTDLVFFLRLPFKGIRTLTYNVFLSFEGSKTALRIDLLLFSLSIRPLLAEIMGEDSDF